MSHVWPCLHLNDQSSKWFRIVSANLRRMSLTTPGPKVFKWNGLSCMWVYTRCWQHYWIEIDEKCIVRSDGPNNTYQIHMIVFVWVQLQRLSIQWCSGSTLGERSKVAVGSIVDDVSNYFNSWVVEAFTFDWLCTGASEGSSHELVSQSSAYRLWSGARSNKIDRCPWCLNGHHATQNMNITGQRDSARTMWCHHSSFFPYILHLWAVEILNLISDHVIN